MVESSYFPRPEYQEALGAYVRVQINSEGAPAEQAAWERYSGVERILPTYAILEADGTLVSKAHWSGAPDSGDVLLEWIRANRKP